MADFIISPYAISYNSIRQALQNYIANKSDLTTKWQDFYTAGAGQSIIEMDAAVAAFYAFHFIIGRRESFLSVAQNYSSIVGGALSLGYNCSRGHNIHLRIEITPNATQTLSKWTVIGSYAEYDVVLLGQYGEEETDYAVLNKGVPTTIDVVIGNSSVQAVSIPTTDLQQFVFTASDTTDDCRLILTDKEVPCSTELKDAMNDKYIMLTNPYGSVDVFYLNTGEYKYTTSDTLYLQYIERNNLQFGALSKSQLSIDVASQIDDWKLLEDRLEKESGEHIRISAPIYHETNNVVRARKDYVKFLLENNPLIIDANDKDINPGLIALTYLKEYDSEALTSLLTEQEKQNYIKSIMSICPDGVAKAFIENPVKVIRSLAITLWQKSGEMIPATIEDDIDTILNKYRNQLAPVLDLQQIEHDIEQLPGVKVARVDLGASEYENNKKYKLYDVITVPNIQIGTEYQTWTLYCGKVQSKTGEDEPDWASAPSVGNQIQDNNFIWENSNKYSPSISAAWKKDGKYELYSDINVGYKVAPKCTLSTQPIWGSQVQKDGNVTWNMLKDYISVLKVRQNNTKYEKDQQVIVEDSTNRAIYTVKRVLHKSGSKKPNWSVAIIDGTIADNALTWTCKYDIWKPEYNYIIGQKAGYVKDGVLYIYSSLTDGITTTTNLFDGSNRITDGTIVWKLEEKITNYTNWTANTEIGLGYYVNGSDRFFEVTDIANTISGSATYSDFPTVIGEEFTDNNIIWTIDTYTIDGTEHPCKGGCWLPSTPYEYDDIIICSSTASTYVYRVNYVGEEEIQQLNIIYSVVNYAGTTSSVEPTWGDNNVVDNDILWTKTENVSDITWQPSTTKRHGDIITTSEGYYVFSSVLGTSGATDPDWAGIENNQVKDNNITWVRITDNASMALQWNEYLDLKADSPKIV